jgi:hypothetical protein
MQARLIIWILALVIILGPGLHQSSFWGQLETQALAADLAEGDQP